LRRDRRQQTTFQSNNEKNRQYSNFSSIQFRKIYNEYHKKYAIFRSNLATIIVRLRATVYFEVAA